MLSQDEANYSQYSGYWLFYTQNRVAVKVSDAKGTPLAGIKVELKLDGESCWEAVTDNLGSAELLASLYKPINLKLSSMASNRNLPQSQQNGAVNKPYIMIM